MCTFTLLLSSLRSSKYCDQVEVLVQATSHVVNKWWPNPTMQFGISSSYSEMNVMLSLSSAIVVCKFENVTLLNCFGTH